MENRDRTIRSATAIGTFSKGLDKWIREQIRVHPCEIQRISVTFTDGERISMDSEDDYLQFAADDRKLWFNLEKKPYKKTPHITAIRCSNRFYGQNTPKQKVADFLKSILPMVELTMTTTKPKLPPIQPLTMIIQNQKATQPVQISELFLG